MHLSRVVVNGFRASAAWELACDIPGRFAVLVGANNTGKTTLSEALYLGHTKTFPRLSRPSASVLGKGQRSVEIEYSFETDPASEGPLGSWLHAQSGTQLTGTAGYWRRDFSRDLGRPNLSTPRLPPENPARQR
jgi:putative ATP-dependent endonuclease of OLD family